jgi:DNA-binding transcriptional LysR family regulator
MGYRKIDLNLVALFDTMMRHRSVTASARELGVTASAVSHGLARLRRLVGDELFVTRPQGMEPTARAHALAPDVYQGLGRLTAALEERSFDPGETPRTFAIAASDYACSAILPTLMRDLARSAPQIHIKVFPTSRLDVVRHLDEDRVQAVMGWFDVVPERLHRHTLLLDQEAIVVRLGHPLLADAITRTRLLSFPHLVVEVTGSEDRGADGFIDERGVRRRVWIERLLIEADTHEGGPVGRVAMTVPRYADVPPILNATDMVATLPRRLALHVAARDGLAVLEPPYDPPTIALEMICHERAAADPGLRWLIDQIKTAATHLPPG